MPVNPEDQRHLWGAAFCLAVQFIEHKPLTIACLHEVGWGGTTQCKVGRVHKRPRCSEAAQHIGRRERDARGTQCSLTGRVSRGWQAWP